MAVESKNIVTLPDLGMAYRKAKVDLYYSSHPPFFEILEYEKELRNNLIDLRDKINSRDESWICERSFLGGWTLIPKGIEPNDESAHSAYISPRENWDDLCKKLKKKDKKPRADFRLMSKASLGFHVLSALWIAKVGHKYDEGLSKSVFGNRVKRGQDGKFNDLSLGSFWPYPKPYRLWRDGGIDAIRGALEKNMDVVSFSTDAKSFYHELSPDFMLDNEFLGLIKLELTDDEIKISRLLIDSIKKWGDNTPKKGGLPVGLPASAIIANMALAELDEMIFRDVRPIHYGRYVDDIMLVLENDKFQFCSPEKVRKWLVECSSELLRSDEKGNGDIILRSRIPNKKEIIFSKTKTKTFFIGGEYGKTFLGEISREIHRRASEWRALPNVPIDTANLVPTSFAKTKSNSEIAVSLGKVNPVTTRRTHFALELRDAEAHERILPPSAWTSHRHKFLHSFIQDVLVLPNLFYMEIFIPRVIRIATACDDFEILREILETLHGLHNDVKKSCDTYISACDERKRTSIISNTWQEKMDLISEESITSAFPHELSIERAQAWEEYLSKQRWISCKDDPIKEIKSKQQELFNHDLAHIPFRLIGLAKYYTTLGGVSIEKLPISETSLAELVSSEVKKGASIIAGWLRSENKKGFLHALVFPTRPYNLDEMYLLDQGLYEKSGEVSDAMRALRGFSVAQSLPTKDTKEKSPIVFVVGGHKKPEKIRIALASWKTYDKSFRASVTGIIDPDCTRYQRLMRLLNELRSYTPSPHYLVMPELSLPASWFIHIARKLNRRGISLISGVEYIKNDEEKTVMNQVWAALSHVKSGFKSMIIVKQDKNRPALHEEKELFRLRELKLKPENPWLTPPLIFHGNFHFAILTCSELTNISYRAALSGKVDALFVPEWNRDTESFSALVESAALDIHSYIIQCNDREFGDSRIRAPYKDAWKRDIIRTKGGMKDYFVIGEIDVPALRAFQSSDRSPSQPFKPIPDGFEIAYERRTLPSGDAH